MSPQTLGSGREKATLSAHPGGGMKLGTFGAKHVLWSMTISNPCTG